MGGQLSHADALVQQLQLILSHLSCLPLIPCSLLVPAGCSCFSSFTGQMRIFCNLLLHHLQQTIAQLPSMQVCPVTVQTTHSNEQLHVYLVSRLWSLQVIQPVRSRAHDNVSGTIASGLDMWHDAHGSSSASRFASHSAWDVQHDEQILQDAAKYAGISHCDDC